MNRFAKFLLISILCASPATADDGKWTPVPGAPDNWEDALPAAFGKKAVLLLDTPVSVRLRGSLLPEDAKNPLPAATTGAWLELFPRRKETGLVVEWLGEQAMDFQRFSDATPGIFKSTSRAGHTTITRTVVASPGDDTVFIHLLAGHPGALSFRVKLDPPGGGPVVIEDRRQLIHIPAEGGGPASHVWVFPFESEVGRDGNGLAVRGEGEALVVWNFGEKGAISETWKRIAARHDPEQDPPDPIKIWEGVLSSHRKSAENSP